MSRLKLLGDHFSVQDEKNKQHSLIALVVDSDFIFGLARMFQEIGEFKPERFKVFRNLDDAKSWLLSGS